MLSIHAAGWIARTTRADTATLVVVSMSSGRAPTRRLRLDALPTGWSRTDVQLAFALEVGQLGCEIGGARDPILQRDEIIWAGVLRDQLRCNVVESDTRTAPDANVLATFMMLAQQHPRRRPEGSEQVFFGADGLAHHDDHADRVVDDLLEHLLSHAAGVAAVAEDSEQLGALAL